jgi:hypothetical protein
LGLDKSDRLGQRPFAIVDTPITLTLGSTLTPDGVWLCPLHASRSHHLLIHLNGFLTIVSTWKFFSA